MSADSMAGSGLFSAVTQWQAHHGRHGLAWQGTRDPYRVWLSEIMLQQTQVSTVLNYYDRFLQRFPDVHALASAHLDDVLALWSGLGYYSRARHLHRCAQQVVECFQGHFPPDSLRLQTLPGIGPSTAAAIAAFCFGERISIFDGNVKRVLSRYLGFDQDLSDGTAEKRLMALTQAQLPEAPTAEHMIGYTQGLMDLGATVCTRRQPACEDCPLRGDCVAREKGLQQVLPLKTKRIKRSTAHWWLLVARHPNGAVWLERRPDSGIWAAMHCFPVFQSKEALLQMLQTTGGVVEMESPSIMHVLTHRDLLLTPVICAVPATWTPLQHVPSAGRWIQPGGDVDVGLPQPVMRWLSAWAADICA
jgi:A/G-specific adenine glycosylase